MFEWRKLGRIFDPGQIKELAWLSEFSQAPSTLIFDDFVRIYFSCRPPRDSNGQYVSYTAYLDVNRKNIFEIIKVGNNPILPLGNTGTFDEFGIYPASVIRDGNEIRAYYGGWTRCVSVPFNVAIGLALSHDSGETFSKLGDGPVLSYNPEEPFIISSPKIRRYNGKWVLWYIAGKKWLRNSDTKAEPVYKIRMATSDNGIEWSRSNADLIESRLEEDECQASPDVFYSNGKYHMFFCYRYSLDYRNKDRGYRIGYACSNDMFNWTRDDSKAGISISSQGWDSEMVCYPHIFQLDEKIYMLYIGNDVGKHGFGAAELIGQL